MLASRSYHDFLIESLRQDPFECAEYWDIVLEEGTPEEFDMARNNVAEALDYFPLRYANMFIVFIHPAVPDIAYCIFTSEGKGALLGRIPPEDGCIEPIDTGYWEWNDWKLPFEQRKLILHDIDLSGRLFGPTPGIQEHCEEMLKEQFKKYCRCMRFTV